ncbi:MAG: Gfo/Idh/MocA family oxidoreductase [Actinomycetota bacterium]|nr:Gfo/Idh/MocA family oxidoreductase [Actinomycetota bacterium]
MSLKLAVIGAGVMGVNHARVITESRRAELSVVIDTDLRRAKEVALATGSKASARLDPATGCDAAIVSSPTDTHVEVAMTLLEAGVPLLIEKPVALDVDDVRRVTKESEARDLPLLCGFVERFNPVIATAASLMHEAPTHILAMRHSPHAARVTTSVVYDLLVHDIDLAIRLAGSSTISDIVSATWTPPGSTLREVADCTIRFDTGHIATLSASRASQRKVRLFNITTPEALFELDLLRQDISIYRHVRQEQLISGATSYRAETIVDIPFVRHAGEPLALQLEHFLDLVEGVADPSVERDDIMRPHEVAAVVEASS